MRLLFAIVGMLIAFAVVFAGGIAVGQRLPAPCIAPAASVEVPYAKALTPIHHVATVPTVEPESVSIPSRVVKAITIRRPAKLARASAEPARASAEPAPVAAPLPVVRVVKLTKPKAHNPERPVREALQLKSRATSVIGSVAAKAAHAHGGAIVIMSPDGSHTYVRTFAERAMELREAGTG